MKNVFVHCITIFIMLMSSFALSAQNMEDYRDMMNLDTDELMRKGQDCMDREKMDSALMFYSIVSNRAYGTDDKELIKKCCEAYIKKSMIYFSYFYDYSKAYDNILAAMELRNEYFTDYILVDIRASIFYHVIAVTCRNWGIERMALDYSYKAYEGALKNNSRGEMDIIVANMIIMSCNLKDTAMLEKVWKTYENDGNQSFSYRFNNVFYDYLKYLIAKNYDEALKSSQKMLELASSVSEKRRIILSYNSIQEAYYLKGEYATALLNVDKLEKLVKKWNMRDNYIEILDKKQQLYRKIGENSLADKYSRMYYMNKDSLLNLKQMTNICRTQYSGESKKMVKEIEKITITNKIYGRVFVVFVIFVIILIVMLVALYVKMKQLKKSNITIYENIENNLRNEYKERQKLKYEVQRFEQNENVTVSEVAGDDTNITEVDEKYRKNIMSEEEKKKLLDKILTVMEDVDEICSDSFSGARLAELTGYKYNYVSLVINENYGCNFNTLLNKFRIKEACRRLADEENYGNYTIDTIANSLGFKSRTTLATSFKKIVGLTPSQYRSISREKNKEIKSVY